MKTKQEAWLSRSVCLSVSLPLCRHDLWWAQLLCVVVSIGSDHGVESTGVRVQLQVSQALDAKTRHCFPRLPFLMSPNEVRIHPLPTIPSAPAAPSRQTWCWGQQSRCKEIRVCLPNPRNASRSPRHTHTHRERERDAHSGLTCSTVALVAVRKHAAEAARRVNQVCAYFCPMSRRRDNYSQFTWVHTSEQSLEDISLLFVKCSSVTLQRYS